MTKVAVFFGVGVNLTRGMQLGGIGGLVVADCCYSRLPVRFAFLYCSLRIEIREARTVQQKVPWLQRSVDLASLLQPAVDCRILQFLRHIRGLRKTTAEHRRWSWECLRSGLLGHLRSVWIGRTECGSC